MLQPADAAERAAAERCRRGQGGACCDRRRREPRRRRQAGAAARAAGRVPLQQLPLSGLAANHTVPPMRIEEGSVVSLQQRDGKRIDHGRVPTAAQYGPSARQVRIPEKWHLRINDTRFFLLDANSDLARLRHTTYNVLDVQSDTSIADLLSEAEARRAPPSPWPCPPRARPRPCKRALPSPGGARSQGKGRKVNTGPRGLALRSGFPLAAERPLWLILTAANMFTP